MASHLLGTGLGHLIAELGTVGFAIAVKRWYKVLDVAVQVPFAE
jgi:hypothetical protein